MPDKNKPGPFVNVGSVDRLRKLPRGTSRIYTCDGVDVAVFQMKPGYLAVSDTCPHMGASLGKGRFRNGAVECHWHEWTFDIKSGECLEKAGYCLDTYDAMVEGDDLYLRLRPNPADHKSAGAASDDDEEDWGKFNPDLYFKKPARDD
jgi:nitrite reductase/ring-hydroxylating ferredoxin subunit